MVAVAEPAPEPTAEPWAAPAVPDPAAEPEPAFEPAEDPVPDPATAEPAALSEGAAALSLLQAPVSKPDATKMCLIIE